MAELTAETITVDDCSVEMRRGGSGATMLFLHGAGGIRDGAPFMAELADRFSFHAPSHPGFGRSDTPDWIDNMSDMAYFYLDMIEQLDLRDIHLVGNSLGGWLAAEMAVRNSDRLKTLTLISPAGIRVVGVPMGDIFMWSPEEHVRATVYDQKLADEQLAANVSEEDAEISLKNHFQTAKLAWSPRFHNPDLEKWLHRIRIPTMILWGEHDRIFPPAYGEAYHAAIPGSELRILPDCGHLPHREKLTDFLTVIDDITKKGAAS